jgi:hypothetical protein
MEIAMSGEENAFITIGAATVNQINKDETEKDPFGRHSNHVAMLRQRAAQKGGRDGSGNAL